VLKQYPLLSDITPTTIELSEGEMLYLPASWFHEVTSFARDAEYHMAINYWYHPPPCDGSFEQPYQDDFWKHQ
jgi:hypothetical protein